MALIEDMKLTHGIDDAKSKNMSTDDKLKDIFGG